ncbi:hypothetical protein [Pelomonas sp. SE-A7]|uniref:esterase/lipase family protein n=1 Tax=Pelomonas sp. SE-A7 TaxID=3054953 RepID=UPI00259CA422|nr:hypothetical protein [Pelomonas sp. SE-A7]MDM4768210.1 hypothetical protein [Pelomonas sp. SE-A7]
MAETYYPIIYVRGYAMTEAERNETAVDPFCGFNLGSTVYRAGPSRQDPAKKFVFESPLLRLAAEHGYSDVYENGLDIMDPDWRPRSIDGQPGRGIPPRSVVIYRYYDEGSAWFGNGKSQPIEHYCQGLSELILRVRELVLAHQGEAMKAADFRCYLVAHSMGGLVVRGMLQNPRLGSEEARRAVDKVFTYATPHNGIEVAGRNVPSWMGLNEINTFSHERMKDYLNLDAVYLRYQRVDFLPSRSFPLERFFCMVGTNRSDYDAALGLSRTFAGHGSDGLVKVGNASVWGVDEQGNIAGTAPTAYCYRSHSGPFGIVNSEEAYQNLSRFLFGDVRVDLWVQVDEVRLPAALEDQAEVQALYQFELLARPRGKRWYLSRRTSEEDSPACRSHQELLRKDSAGNLVYLSTVFLSNRSKVSNADRTLAYAMDVAVRVPDYLIEKRFWPDQHFEGSHLFRDSLQISLEPPAAAGGEWGVKHGWESQQVGQATRKLSYTQVKGGGIRIEVPLPKSQRKPGLDGRIVLMVSAWN